MMTEKTRLFKDHRAVELIISSSDPSTLQRVDRGVRIFDTAVWDREKENGVLSGNYANIMINPAMTLHLSSTGNKRCQRTVLWTQCGLMVSARTTPAPRTHTSGEEKFAR